MLAMTKALFAAIAFATAAVAGAAASVPLENAISVLQDHVSPGSDLPDGGVAGNENALAHLQDNQEMWLVNHNITLPTNETA